MSKPRLRFAPSPTGYLHIGSLRTALFNYLAAKSMGGKLILRIEDTDAKRKVEGAVESLIKILDWVGVKFDEGPYVQSERKNIYDKHIKKLIEEDKAYYCFCTPERLQKMREDQQQNKKAPRYDRCCRDLSKDEINKKIKSGEKFVIRQKMPLDGEVVSHDELRGYIKFNASDLEDHVLIKSNGIPTYQFASVVDDYEMKITHVIRGEEWIPSFPKNILLYKDFGWAPPKFFHMPLTLNKEGGKLSKRQGDVAVEDYRDKGYLKEALINFCVLLGWHPKDNKELFTLEELEKEFKLEDMGTSPAIFDIEKLDYINGYYIRQMDLEKLVELCKPYLGKNLKKTPEFIKKVIATEQERLKKLSEIGELTEFFFVDKLRYDSELLIWKKLSELEVKNNLEQVLEQLEKIPEKNWTNDSIEDALISYIKAKEEKVGNFLWPMRVALTGRKASPGPFEVAEVLGKEESLKRVEEGISKL
ncbi:MAG: glutamate--tRNA ligase [Candidatus Falkowbacteria bacterium]